MARLLQFLLLMVVTGAIGVSAQSSMNDPAPSCKSRRTTSALAVSIVYAACDESTLLAAGSMATATASRCSDTIAASIGVSLAYLSSDNMGSTVTAAFSSVLTLGVAKNGGVVLAQSLALAIASATPTTVSPAAFQADMIQSLVEAIGSIAQTAGCKAALSLADSVYDTFMHCGATDLAGLFKADLAAYITSLMGDSSSAISGPCKQMQGNKLGTGSGPSWLTRKQKGSGNVNVPLFSNGIGSLKLSSTVAVSIAEAGCPDGGNAAVAAVAIATAYNTDQGAAVDAIAGVLASGVPVTPVVTQVFMSPSMPGRSSAIQAFAAAIIAVTPEQQQALMSAVSEALQLVAQQLGCQQAGADMALLKSIITEPGMYQSLCTIALLCPGSC